MRDDWWGVLDVSCVVSGCGGGVAGVREIGGVGELSRMMVEGVKGMWPVGA